MKKIHKTVTHLYTASSCVGFFFRGSLNWASVACAFTPRCILLLRMLRFLRFQETKEEVRLFIFLFLPFYLF
jgi:hypothetical protein